MLWWTADGCTDPRVSLVFAAEARAVCLEREAAAGAARRVG